MKLNKKSLAKKGWTAKEIKDAEGRLKKIPLHSQITVYWISIFVMIFLTILISLWLVPFLMAIAGWVIFLILFIIGLIFGAMLQNLIIHLEQLEHRHHLMAVVLVPLTGIISLFIMVRAAEFGSALLNLNIVQNPLELASFYLIGFLLPYVYGWLYNKQQPL